MLGLLRMILLAVVVETSLVSWSRVGLATSVVVCSLEGSSGFIVVARSSLFHGVNFCSFG